MLSGKNVDVRSHNNVSQYHAARDLPQNGTELPYAKNLLWMVFANSKGGQNRIRTINVLKKSPRNAHQLAKELGLNYRAIQHHIGVLEKNNLISHVGEKYGTTYFLSTFFEVNVAIFDELAKMYRSK